MNDPSFYTPGIPLIIRDPRAGYIMASPYPLCLLWRRCDWEMFHFLLRSSYDTRAGYATASPYPLCFFYGGVAIEVCIILRPKRF